jgi:general secretion pathway protein D
LESNQLKTISLHHIMHEHPSDKNVTSEHVSAMETKKMRLSPQRRAHNSLLFLLCSLLTTSLTACTTSPEGGLPLHADPVLATDAPHVEEGGIDTTKVNLEPADNEPTEFIGILKNGSTNISISPSERKQNVDDLRLTGAVEAHLGEAVTISFENDSMNYVIKQLLGGLLSANYVVAADVGGTVSFKTEVPVPRAAIPSILRDILARNGYVMKVINGVYQIGTAETIAALEQNAAIGVAGEYKNRVINLGRGNLSEIAAAVEQILPTGATVTPVPSSNSIVLRVNPADETPIVELVQALVNNSGGDDLITVIRLRESPPETVAASMNTYFASSANTPTEVPLIIPLEQQQALLVIARSQSLMNNVRTLVKGLDKENRDGPSLRIISLRNLPASDIAEQLNKSFSTGEAGDPATQAPTSELTVQPGQGVAPAAEEEGGGSLMVPQIISRSPDVKTSRPSSQPVAASDESSPAAPRRATGEGISIVPDNRNNALLVYATYSQFKRIRDVVGALDVPLAQVVIEATIVEVALNDRLKLGVQAFLQTRGLKLRSSEFSQPTESSDAGGTAAFSIDTIAGMSASVVLEALQTVTNVKIISSPYLTVLDGRAARLSVGDQIPYLVQQTSASQSGEIATTNEIQVRDVGIILEVTPTIHSDNSVMLKVQQEVSSAKSTGAGANLTPTITQRAINSDVVVQSGKTVLLGGLIQDRSEKITSAVPGLSKVPVFGKLFKQTTNMNDRTELLVMITPRVVRSSLQLDGITRLLRSRAVTGQ